MRCFTTCVLVLGLVVAASAAASSQEVLSEVRHELEHQGITVIETRTLDLTSGTIRRETRTPDGRRVDLDGLLHREDELRTLARGKMSPDLSDRIAAAPSAATALEVAFWLRIPGAPDFRLVLEDARDRGFGPEDARRIARDTAEAFFRPHTLVFARDLEARGYEVSYTGTCWPVVIALSLIHI